MNYEKIHDRLIQYRLQNPATTDFERHHIKPRSLYPDLIVDESNIVQLTLREHLFCHKLLVKIYADKYGVDSIYYNRMIIALNNMMGYTRYKKFFSSREYETARKNFYKNYSDRLKEAWKNYPKEKMDKLREKRKINARGENNPMYHRDWREGKSEDEILAHNRNSAIGHMKRTEEQKQQTLNKLRKTISQRSYEEKQRIIEKRNISREKFYREHPDAYIAYRQTLKKACIEYNSGKRMMINLKTKECKFVIKKEIKTYEINGWQVKRDYMKERLDRTNPAFGRKWMYHPNTREQVYVKGDEIKRYIELGFQFGNIRSKEARNKTSK